MTKATIMDLGMLVKQTEIRLSKEMNRFASQYDLTGTQMSIIDFLGRHSDQQVSQKAIENELGIQRSTATIILQRMEKRALVKRTPDPQDRRHRTVKLTTTAKQLFPIVKRHIDQ
ncbi:MarR family winged helix-turn-helix transcriptional regulator [Limosilactobacillus caecicola]|uniref:MarR family winged helix-turn-helix transcriptional regulator n=1 Tax=Limosilactobacillus caecicola TaxID=2941332 RepID=UPI002041DC23|nr:MarR family transcriptional regulator [Limosilactobacillus caecicola]